MSRRISELCGRVDRPVLPLPPGLLDRIALLGDRVRAAAAALGVTIDVDPWSLVTARVAETGWSRAGSTSCGGATRLMAAADGWVAVSLARPDDRAAVAAWLELPGDPPPDEVWPTVVATAAGRRVADLVERAELLGLPVAALGETTRAAAVVVSRRGTEPPPRRSLAGLRVVDLSALWAGPVCAHLLGRAGAQVTKVESTHRPDGARLGPPGHFAALHDGHQGCVLDLRAPAGRAELGALIESADVVIEGSRPRALRQLGFDAESMVAAGTVQVWVSITAHGRTGPGADRVGFGDDAAVAGGLVAWDGDGPCFVGDALADPLTGLAAAGSVLEVLAAGGSWLVDAALARTAAFAARDTPDPPGPSAPPLPSGP